MEKARKIYLTNTPVTVIKDNRKEKNNNQETEPGRNLTPERNLEKCCCPSKTVFSSSKLSTTSQGHHSSE